MSVSITGGFLKGRILPLDVKAQKVRPTSGKVRQALFNILGSRVEGARFLDLYAGTGAVGFEALSRGARAVTWVEKDPGVYRRLRAAEERLLGGAGAASRSEGVPVEAGPVPEAPPEAASGSEAGTVPAAPPLARFIHRNALVFCREAEKQGLRFDLVFADPPFADDFGPLLAALLPLLAEKGCAIVQYPSRHPPAWTGELQEKRPYGESTLGFIYLA